MMKKYAIEVDGKHRTVLEDYLVAAWLAGYTAIDPSSIRVVLLEDEPGSPVTVEWVENPETGVCHLAVTGTEGDEDSCGPDLP